MTQGITQAFKDETLQIFQNYIRIDTTNPPGDEIKTADFLSAILEKEGIPFTVETSAPKRANLIARLKGRGEKKPLVLLNHMDVVPAPASKWSVPPFSGEIRDGYVYGRGTIDMKGMGIVELMSLIHLKRRGIPLNRDLIFLAVADEETGGVMGAKWVLEHHPELKEIEGVLNEGGGGVLYEGKRWYEVSTSQKVICQVKVTAKGEGGHASVPMAGSAVTTLTEALRRIQQYTFPTRLLPSIQEYFKRLAPFQEASWQPVFTDIEAAVKRNDPILAEIMREPTYHSKTHNTAAVTVLRAGEKVNVVPEEATARVDCRLLPGTSPETFLTLLKEIIHNPQVEIEATFKGVDAPPTPHDTPIFHAIEQAVTTMDPGAVVTPNLVPGATDSRYFRALGIDCYDFCPFMFTPEERRLIHGTDERISTKNIASGVEMMVEILQNLST